MSNTALLFLVLFFVGLLLAFVKHPIYGVLSYMLVFYMSPGESWWSTDLPDLRWSLLSGAITTVAVLVYPSIPSRPAWYRTAPAGWLLLFALWLWIQTPWVLRLDDHLFMAALFSKYVMLYAVLYTSLSDPGKLRLFVLAHVVGCFIWGFTAYQHPGSGRLEELGFGDVAGSAFASMHLGTGIAFAGFAFLGTSGFLRWISFLSIPFILNAIILMATRGAFVGLLGGALAAWFVAPRALRGRTTLYLALGAVLLATLAHDLFWARMYTIVPAGGEQMERSAESRILIAQANFRMFLDHPMGVGHRGNDHLSPEYMDPSLLTPSGGKMIRSAHNTIMAVLVDHGLIGLALLGFFHLSMARSLLRARSLSRLHPEEELAAYIAAIGTGLIIYWGNAQFVNITKAEIAIWMAAMASALQWMTRAVPQPVVVRPGPRNAGDAPGSESLRSPSAQ